MTTRDDLVSELRKIEARLMASNETKADAWDIGLAIEQLTASASALEAKDAEIARLKLKVLGSTFDENIFEARAIAAESRVTSLERQLAEETERCAALAKLHAFVVEHYANQDMNHMDFRVDAYVIAAALELTKEK
jgi:hypothetical protein